MFGICESPKHNMLYGSKTERILYWHSLELYWSDEFKIRFLNRQGIEKTHYKACNECCMADHKAWQNKDLQFNKKRFTI